MNMRSEEEWSKNIEDFVRKSILVVLNSRISSSITQNEAEEGSVSMNSKFCTVEPENFDLDDLFLDEYQELKSSGSLEKYYILDIYFKRKDTKFLIEKWSFKLLNKHDGKKSLDDYLHKKLNILMRSIYTTSRILPAFSVFQKRGFNFSLDYKIYMSQSTNETFLLQPLKKSFDILQSVANFTIEVEFMTKNEIFKLEEEHQKIEKEHAFFRRHRYLSEDNSNFKVNIPSFEILNFEDASIKDNHFPLKNSAEYLSNFGSRFVTPSNKSLAAGNNMLVNANITDSPFKGGKMKKPQSLEKLSLNCINLKNFANEAKVGEDYISLIDSFSSSEENTLKHHFDKSEAGIHLEIEKINNAGSKVSSCLKNVKKLKKIHNRKNFKNFKTSDTSSSLNSSSDSFELDIEYEDNSNASGNPIELDDNLISDFHISDRENVIKPKEESGQTHSKNLKVEEIITKLKNLKKMIKKDNYYNIHFNLINFLKIYNNAFKFS